MHRRPPVSEGNVRCGEKNEYGRSSAGYDKQNKRSQGNPTDGIWVGIQGISKSIEPKQLVPTVRMVGKLRTGRPLVRVSVADNRTV